MGRFTEVVVPARLGSGYRWLLASSWTTNLGDGIALAAGPLLVASLTDNAFLVSLAALLRWAPPLIFGLYAGVLSDRLDPRPVLMGAGGVPRPHRPAPGRPGRQQDPESTRLNSRHFSHSY